MPKLRSILIPLLAMCVPALLALYLRVTASHTAEIGQFRFEVQAEKAAFAQLAKMSARYPHSTSLVVRWSNPHFPHADRRFFDAMHYDRRRGTLEWNRFENGTGAALQTHCTRVSDGALVNPQGAYPGSCGQDLMQIK